ncbi:MAG: hypothetical protein QG594_2057, partial [Bacteroidota bacterium]|nr:hypothetical protein [Bacteroidota bacterium]
KQNLKDGPLGGKRKMVIGRVKVYK